MSPGSTLYIGATEMNNGVTECIGQDALHPGGQLTVSYNGSVAEASINHGRFGRLMT